MPRIRSSLWPRALRPRLDRILRGPTGQDDRPSLERLRPRHPQATWGLRKVGPDTMPLLSEAIPLLDPHLHPT